MATLIWLLAVANKQYFSFSDMHIKKMHKKLMFNRDYWKMLLVHGYACNNNQLKQELRPVHTSYVLKASFEKYLAPTKHTSIMSHYFRIRNQVSKIIKSHEGWYHGHVRIGFFFTSSTTRRHWNRICIYFLDVVCFVIVFNTHTLDTWKIYFGPSFESRIFFMSIGN